MLKILYRHQFNRLNAGVQDVREHMENLCLIDLDYALKLYNNHRFSVVTFLHKEYVCGLIKGLTYY